VLKPSAFAHLRAEILTLLIGVISKVSIVVSVEINIRYAQEASLVLGSVVVAAAQNLEGWFATLRPVFAINPGMTYSHNSFHQTLNKKRT